MVRNGPVLSTRRFDRFRGLGPEPNRTDAHPYYIVSSQIEMVKFLKDVLKDMLIMLHMLIIILFQLIKGH
jgi:hypothetical protein